MDNNLFFLLIIIYLEKYNKFNYIGNFKSLFKQIIDKMK